MNKHLTCKITDSSGWKEILLAFHENMVIELNIDQFTAGDLYVILEELVSNYFKYSMAEGYAKGILVEIRLKDEVLNIKIEYEGIPFDPFKYIIEIESKDVENARIGGRGLQMVKKLADSFHYEKIDKCNLLFLTKNIISELNMNIQLQEFPNYTVVSLEGRLDIMSGESLQKKLDELVDEQKVYQMIIDCEKLSFISSAGLRLFMITLKKLNKLNGKLAFCSFNLNNRKIFDITGYDKFFAIYDNLNDALDAFDA